MPAGRPARRPDDGRLSHGCFVGLSSRKNEPTVRTYLSMIDRCLYPDTPAYPYYGGRGIVVCDRWMQKDGEGFKNFVEDMGERPEGTSLDRIDVNGNYCPENCQWADPLEQSLNKRLQSNNSSGYRGVCWINAKQKWRVEIKKGGIKTHIGYFLLKEDAVAARREAELEYFGREV